MKPETANLIKKIVDWTLLTILICVVIYAQIDGRFINNQIHIIDVCKDQIINNPSNINITPIFK